MSDLPAIVFAPGFWQSGPVRDALLTGGVVAVVAAVVGVFTVVRSQAFAGEAFGDVGTLGGSGAYLVGVDPLWGFVGAGAAVAVTMELFGVERRRGRDVATGVVLGAALGASALFLYLDTTVHTTTGATMTILFGSLFVESGAAVPAMVGLGLVGLAVVALVGRPLLLSSVSPDLAAARGLSVRRLGLVFLLLMGVSVSLSSVVVGTILSTALLVGPAATALRLTARPGRAMAVAAALGVGATWLGVVLAYDSYDWPPAGRGWPVSFFVASLVLAAYLVAGAWSAHRARSDEAGARPAGGCG
jgi:zinc/manganese transport system permease protein